MKYISTLFLALLLGLVSCNTTMKTEETSTQGFVIHRGLNASHWLSQSEIRGEEREQYMQAVDFESIANMGFDHVRIPVDEVHLWDEDGNRHEDAFKLLHNAINWSFDNNLRVIVDLHVIRSHHFNAHDNTLWTDPLEQKKFWGFWEQLSAELIQYPTDKLAYELMNEAVADNPEDWNKLIANGIKMVREKEPTRTIVVGSNKWQQVFTFPELKVPENDTNLILSFHTYEPFLLTHFQTTWNDALMQYTGEVNYPGLTVDTLQYPEFSEELQRKMIEQNGVFNKELLEEHYLIAVKVAKELNLPLYCGEFGCFPTTPMETRVKLYEDWIALFDKYNIAWSHWNYKNDFPVVNEETLEPIEEIVSILVPAE
jgi:endoglucanase